MTVRLDHTIVHCRDKKASAEFITGVLGLPDALPAAHFMSVELANGVVLDYDEREDFVPNHYAFGVGEDELDAILERVRGRGIEFYADPGHHRAGEVRPNPRGFYFSDPDGHNMEVLVASRPSGNG